MVNGLDYVDIKFLVSKKCYGRIQEKIVSASMCSVMRIVWFIHFMYLIKNFKNVWIYF